MTLHLAKSVCSGRSWRSSHWQSGCVFFQSHFVIPHSASNLNLKTFDSIWTIRCDLWRPSFLFRSIHSWKIHHFSSKLVSWASSGVSVFWFCIVSIRNDFYLCDHGKMTKKVGCHEGNAGKSRSTTLLLGRALYIHADVLGWGGGRLICSTLLQYTHKNTVIQLWQCMRARSVCVWVAAYKCLLRFSKIKKNSHATYARAEKGGGCGGEIGVL